MEMLNFKQNDLPAMEYYLCKHNLSEHYHHSQKEIEETFLEFFKSFIKNISIPTLAAKVLEEDLKNMDHIRIVVIQQEKMLHNTHYYNVSVNKTPSTLHKPCPALKKVDSDKTNPNKNLKCEKCIEQGLETSKCWSGNKKVTKDTSSNKTQVKFSQSDSKNKSQNHDKSSKQ